MRKINFIFQEVLKVFLIFLISFIWLRYFIRQLVLSIVISAILTTLIYLILFFIKRKKKNKEGLKIKEKEEAENMFLSLACDNNKMDFFLKLASSKHKNVKKFSKFLIISHENNTKTLLYPKMDFEPLTIPNFVDIYKKMKGKAEKVVILCHSYDKEVLSFSKHFGIYFLIFDRFETYERLYKYYDIFPEIKESYKKDKMLTFKDFIAFSFNKKRAKGYLLSAFLLALSAIFVRTTIYYTIVATLLVVFAIISQFNTKFNFKEDKEIL